MVPGGRVFVWPVIQRVQRISLNTMTLSIESAKVYTQQGVPISVTGIAQVKIQVGSDVSEFPLSTRWLSRRPQPTPHQKHDQEARDLAGRGCI